MPRFPSPRPLAALLSGTLAIVGALPVAALAATQGAPPAGEPVLAQAAPPAAREIPAEVKGWVEEAKAAYQKGEPAKALQLQLQALAWVKAHLGPAHPFRAEVLSNLGLFLSEVGRRQEALAPSEEALKIYPSVISTVDYNVLLDPRQVASYAIAEWHRIPLT
ncbi:MAG: tetratricopeptide repeat protein [Cyanobium sp.]